MFSTLALREAISAPFKRAQLGLFGGKTKQSGNNVPFSKKKTRRTWLPNVHNQRLFSDTLQQFIRVKITARALRTVKKVRGGMFSDASEALTCVAAWRHRPLCHEHETGAPWLGGHAHTARASRTANGASSNGSGRCCCNDTTTARSCVSITRGM